MKNKRVMTVIAIVSLAILGTTVFGVLGGNSRKKAMRGDLSGSALVFAWQSHSDHVAGAWIKASGNIEGIGKVETDLKMAYTWDYYGFNYEALLYSESKTLTDTKDYTPYEGTFEADATFTIEDASGDKLVLNIEHGDCHQGATVYWDTTPPGGQGTENEWLIGLSVDDTACTGKFSGATGSGTIRLVVISNNVPSILLSAKYIAAYQITLSLGETLLPPDASYTPWP